MEKLARTGRHCLFSCNQVRPGFLFKDGTCKEIQKDGNSVTLYGEVEGKRSGEKVPFLVNTFQSKGQKLCTMSTAFSDTPIETELEILVEDDSEEKQSQFEKLKEVRPEVRNKYVEIMNFVDNADQYVSSALSPNRKRHWTTAEKLWEITILLVVNAKKLYESASGVSDIQGPTWQKMIRRMLLQLPTFEKDAHPPSAKAVGDARPPKARCRSCAHAGKDQRTVWRCPVCGPICKHCQAKDKSERNIHTKFYLLSPTSWIVRRAYKHQT